MLERQLEGFNLVPIVPIDCQEDPEDLANKFQVRNLPTLILVDDDNNLITKFTGQITRNTVEQVVSEHLGQPWKKQ